MTNLTLEQLNEDTSVNISYQSFLKIKKVISERNALHRCMLAVGDLISKVRGNEEFEEKVKEFNNNPADVRIAEDQDADAQIIILNGEQNS